MPRGGITTLTPVCRGGVSPSLPVTRIFRIRLEGDVRPRQQHASQKGHSSAEAVTLDNSAITEILALGLTLFGLCIFYENDHTARNRKRWTLLLHVRLDGLRDCEAVAKESRWPSPTFWPGFFQGLVLGEASGHGSELPVCSCLGSVRRHPDQKFEARFQMLVPNALFPDNMLTDAGESKRVQLERSSTFRTYMCDGVYDCHPSKTKVPRDEDTCGRPGSTVAIRATRVPWCSERPKCTSETSKASSVALTNSSHDISHADGCAGNRYHHHSTREAATAVKCSIPRCVRTFGHPRASPLQRWKVTMDEATRLASDRALSGQYEEKTLRTSRLRPELAPRMDEATHDELLQKSSEFREFAAQLQPDGSMSGKRLESTAW